MSDWCKTCDEFMVFAESHRCPPKWLIWSEECGEGRDDAQAFHGVDAAEAAEKWANDYDCYGDYTIVGGHTINVFVVPADDDEATPKKFSVSGEAVPQYHAEEADA